MIVSDLSYHVKNATMFGWQKGPSDLYKNLYLNGSALSITLSMSDGNCGYRNVIPQSGIPIIGECCVDVFKFSDILSKLDQDSDIKVIIKENSIIISNYKDKIPIKSQPVDQCLNQLRIDKDKFAPIPDNFIGKIKSVLPPLDDEIPIVYNGEYIFYGNPKTLFYTPDSTSIESFGIDQKYVNRLYIEPFDRIYKSDGRIHFSNNNCQIYIPLYNGKELKIAPVVKMINDNYNSSCKVNIKELIHCYNLIRELSDGNDTDKVLLNISSDVMNFEYGDSSFKMNDYKYNYSKNVVLPIPIKHLKVITKPSFKNNEYIEIKLADNMSMFVVQNEELMFVGGLYRS